MFILFFRGVLHRSCLVILFDNDFSFGAPFVSLLFYIEKLVFPSFFRICGNSLFFSYCIPSFSYFGYTAFIEVVVVSYRISPVSIDSVSFVLSFISLLFFTGVRIFWDIVHSLLFLWGSPTICNMHFSWLSTVSFLS